MDLPRLLPREPQRQLDTRERQAQRRVGRLDDTRVVRPERRGGVGAQAAPDTMMDPAAKTFAVGYGFNELSSYGHHWTQMFGR